jgi:hypothetical protein
VLLLFAKPQELLCPRMFVSNPYKVDFLAADSAHQVHRTAANGAIHADNKLRRGRRKVQSLAGDTRLRSNLSKLNDLIANN